MENGNSFALPISYKTGAAVVCGTHTDVVITDFQDSCFVIASQFEKMGNLTEVSIECSTQDPLQIIYSSKVLLGKDEPEIHAIARNLAERLQFSKSVVFGLALKSHTPETAKHLGDLIEKIKKS